MIAAPVVMQSQGVSESEDAFLALFPHRFDYLYAEHAEPGRSPNWRTETRHPLSDRLIRQGHYLFGVRFGPQTRYCLIDIDITSAYHPKRDPFAIGQIAAALEPLGLVRYVACTSSYSGGIHLYFPLEQAQSSWKLAIALETLLSHQGFKVAAGQLELFPNPRPYQPEQPAKLFNGHRLPLQHGSYLLDRDFETTYTSESKFLQVWHSAQRQNQVNGLALKRILKQVQRKQHCLSGKADKFINDLNAEIETGWTGHGQTNHLLGRITIREYIFHHVLHGDRPLQGEALVEAVVDIAQGLPGYREWCRHQHEIRQRAEEWAKCIEGSHYFPYGTEKGKYKPQKDKSIGKSTEASYNQKQAEAAREKIKNAIADLIKKNCLPEQTTTRFQALVHYGIGGSTLYRHKDLWHPNCPTSNWTSLLPEIDSNPSSQERFNDCEQLSAGVIARNGSSGQGQGDRKEDSSVCEEYPVVSERCRIVCEEYPIVCEQCQLIGDECQPVPKEPRPISKERQPISEEPRPISEERQPISEEGGSDSLASVKGSVPSSQVSQMNELPLEVGIEGGKLCLAKFWLHLITPQWECKPLKQRST
jgi:hypothetical protein